MGIYRKTFLYIVIVAFMVLGATVAKGLEYAVIEDTYDDTTQIRTITEQALVPEGKGWLIRTTRYTPYTTTNMNVVSVPFDVTKKGLFQYEVIEDVYDDTTQTRTVTEQAFVADGKGRLIRTTRYTLNAISMDVVFIP